MRPFLLSLLTFIFTVFISLLLRAFASEIFGPSAISILISLITLIAIIYLPIKVYKANK